MFPLKKRALLPTVAIAGFILITCLIVQSFHLPGLRPESLRNYREILLFLFGLVIILSWISMGMVGGITLLSGCSFVTLLTSIASKSLYYTLQLLLYIGIGLVGTHFWQKVKRTNRLDEVKLEKVEETARALAIECERQMSQTEGLRKRFQRYSTLKDLTEVLSSGLSLEEVVKLVAKRSFQVIGKGDGCLVYLVEAKEELALVAQEQELEGLPIEEADRGDIFDKWVLKQRQPLVITDIQKDLRFSLEEKDESLKRWRSLVIAPVISKERIIALLRLNSETPDTYTPDDLRLLDIISGLASVAIENALLYKRTEELAIKDGLTGLYVHRYFLERLQEEQERAKLMKTNLSLLMCDLDHFKGYNDQYGHTAGDILLERIAEILVENSKDDSLVARYGGEEFCIILPEMDSAHAKKVAEKIRKAVEEEILVIRRAQTRITISIGVVTYPEDATTPEELIRLADGAMYKAKQQGRNRVCTV